MDRILPGILVVAATLLSCDGGCDAAATVVDVDRRYGGRSILGQPPPPLQSHQLQQRPSYFFGQYAVGHGRPAFGPAPGGHHRPFSHAASVVAYRPSSAPLVFTHGSGHGSHSYHAAIVGYGQADRRPLGAGQQQHQQQQVAQASNQHSSYVRPFGMPEGHRFPFGGFTYRLPDRRPPNPPIRSAYKSKPFPDFIVRFKSPMYPAQVATSVFDKPPPSNLPIGATSSGALLPLYEPGESSGTNTLSVVGGGGGGHTNGHGVSGSGINVGASYQSGGNIPVFVSQIPSAHSIVHPPSTSIYLMSDAAKNQMAADKTELTNGQPAAEAPRTPPLLSSSAFVDINKDSAFGVTSEPSVVRPLKQDVVYSPDETGTLKPMYIFGPVFFPKEEQDTASASASSTDAQKCTSTSTDPSCDSKSAGSDVAAVAASVVVVDGNATNTTTTTTVAASDDVVSTTVRPKKSGKKSVSANSGSGDVVDDEVVDDDADVELDGGGGSRGLIGVIRGILGVGDRDRDGLDDDPEDERLSRGDKNKKKSTKSKGSKLSPIDDDYEDDSPPSRPSSKRRRKPSSSSGSSSSNTRTSGGNNSRRGSNSQSRFIPSHKRFKNGGNGGDVGDVGGHVGQGPAGFEAEDSETSASDHRQTSENKQDDDVNFSNMQNLNGGDDGGFQEPEMTNDNEPVNVPHQQGGVSDDDGNRNHDDVDPIVGPVQVGFIGRPPTGSPYSPNQPFFYAAGIPAFDRNRNPLTSSADFPQLGHNLNFNHDNNFNVNANRKFSDEGNVRRYFNEGDAGMASSGGGGNDLDGDRRHSGVASSNGMDAPMPPRLSPHIRPASYYEGFPQEGYRDYAPGIPIPNDGYNDEEDQLDQEPADSSSSEVTDKSISKSSSSSSSSSSSLSTSPSSSTSPSMSSVSSMSSITVSLNDRRMSTSSSSSSTAGTTDDETRNVVTESLPLSLPYVAARPEPSSKSSATLNDDVIVEHVTTPSPLTTWPSNSDNASRFTQSSDNRNDASTSKAYSSDETIATTSMDTSTSSSTSTATMDSGSPSYYDKLSYSGVTRRRPFPSFYKYRTSVRPKGANYIAPTTYRPATATAMSSSRTPSSSSSSSSSSSTSRFDINDDDYEGRDSSATVVNSVGLHDHNDQLSSSSSLSSSTTTTTSTSSEESSNAIVAAAVPPFRGLEPIVDDDDSLIQGHGFAATELSSPFGSRIASPPSLKHKIKTVAKS